MQTIETPEQTPVTVHFRDGSSVALPSVSAAQAHIKAHLDETGWPTRITSPESGDFIFDDQQRLVPCELCAQPRANEVWRGKRFFAIDASSVDFPCFLRIIAVDHITEMTDLSEEDSLVLHNILRATERLMRDKLCPDKVNTAQFGNVVPHLHWHVVARWRDDVTFPDNPWGAYRREVDGTLTQARRMLAQDFFEALPKVLNEIDPA